MDKNILDDYIINAYEAAFCAVHTDYFGENTLPETVHRAIRRILRCFAIDSIEKSAAFMKAVETKAFKQSAENLLAALQKPASGFFERLDEASAFLYHGANHAVSYEYGVHIANNLALTGLKVADIGGSSGGLARGAQSAAKNAAFTVYDTKTACAVGADIGADVKFIPFDFFLSAAQKADYDILILSNILHDWTEEKCLTILQNIRPLSESARFIVHEDVLFDSGQLPVKALVYGLRLAVNVPGGRQRTVTEILGLFEKAYGGAVLSECINFGALSALLIEVVGKRNRA